MSVKERQSRPKVFKGFRVALVCSSTLTLSPSAPAAARQNAVRRPTRGHARAASHTGGVRVPFDLYGNNILVRVRIDGSRPVWVVFDSGAGVNVINDRAAKKLGLTVGGASTLDALGGTARGSFVEGATISVSGVE